MKQSKQPSTKEKTRMLLTGIWKNHQSRFMDLVGELEELAVGLLLEMKGNRFNPGVKALFADALGGMHEVLQVELASLRKDPRVWVKFKRLRNPDASVAFDDLSLEDRENLVGAMVEAVTGNHKETPEEKLVKELFGKDKQ